MPRSIDLSNEDIGAKNNYNEMNLGQFWTLVINYYPDLLLTSINEILSSIREYIFQT